MITVAAYPVCNIALTPLIEIVSVVKRCFRLFPHIKNLVVYEETHFVTKIHPCRWRRVMRTAHRVYTHFLEFSELTAECINMECCSKRTLVMMLARTVYFLMATI